jgi:hypothetical protein
MFQSKQQPNKKFFCKAALMKLELYKKSAAYNWFKNDQASPEDKKHISTPAISRNNKNKAKICTTNERSVYITLLVEDLSIRHVHAKSVPHILMEG